MTQYMPGCTAKQVVNHLLSIISIYKRGGFRIQTILADNKFNKIKYESLALIFNTMVANGHASEVEPQIRVIKKQAHRILATLPLKKIPKVMAIHLVH